MLHYSFKRHNAIYSFTLFSAESEISFRYLGNLSLVRKWGQKPV
jgi:hypothetical protein